MIAALALLVVVVMAASEINSPSKDNASKAIKLAEPRTEGASQLRRH